MNYGFVIDTRRCIGCHACSTACKSENQVPLGAARTWVKYTETGTFPEASRSFQVTRCNHCADPPCVKICPVTAMYQRDDGIVDFDPDVCIGCKACLQACPYDAVYIDPDNGTAAKCHFCAHRVEYGMEPACVVVCPTHAILAGDLQDPQAEVSQALANHEVRVRKPEQGTNPNVFYIDGDPLALQPTAASSEGMAFAQVLDRHDGSASEPYGDAGAHGPEPVQVASRQAGHMVSVAYNAQHRIPWHWQVPAYLVTKGIASGVFMLLAAAVWTGWFDVAGPAAVIGGALALAMLVATTALLVFDLERPERFLRIVFRPQWGSWLVRGAFLLMGFGLVASVWWGVELAAWLGWASLAHQMRLVLAAVTVPLALGAAIYTAFLFGQCEGRDLWQSGLLPVHLSVQALLLGAVGLAVTAAVGVTVPSLPMLLGVLLVADLVLCVAEVARPHPTDVAAKAADAIRRGHYRGAYWGGAIGLGHGLPLLALASGTAVGLVVACVSTIVGLYIYEHVFVLAAQEVPNS